MRRLNVPALVKTDRGRRGGGGGEVGGGAFRVSVGRCDAEARRGAGEAAVCRWGVWGGGEERRPEGNARPFAIVSRKERRMEE